MPAFRALFEAYGGNYDATMTRFMGNEAMYLRLLDMLFQDDNLQKLGDALAVGDRTAAFEAAHTLKGVAGNMGLEPLYNAVCAVVEPLRCGGGMEGLTALYQAVCSEFERAAQLREALYAGGRA